MLLLHSLQKLGRWELAHAQPSDECILTDPTSVPYTDHIDKALGPHLDILTALFQDPNSVSSLKVPAKAWLESETKKPKKKSQGSPSMGKRYHLQWRFISS